MKQMFNTTVLFYPKGNPKFRLAALWYFTTLMIVWNILGHTVLGFEQSWAAPFVGIGSALLMSMLLDWVDAWAKGRQVRFTGSVSSFLNFLPSSFIPGFACAMLLYANDRLWPIAFAATFSMVSKVLLRAPVGNGYTQHVFNPSNIGVALTLVLFPQVGFAPPYHFTENLTGIWDWVAPGVVLVTGVFLHAVFTGRLALVGAWLLGFACQALLRAWWFDAPWHVPLVPMTSAAFILFTLYMIPDPATTPINAWRQALFGFAVASVYGVLQVLHIVFGLFFALVIVCAIRGLSLHLYFRVAGWSGKTASDARSRTGMAAAARVPS